MELLVPAPQWSTSPADTPSVKMDSTARPQQGSPQTLLIASLAVPLPILPTG